MRTTRWKDCLRKMPIWKLMTSSWRRLTKILSRKMTKKSTRISLTTAVTTQIRRTRWKIGVKKTTFCKLTKAICLEWMKLLSRTRRRLNWRRKRISTNRSTSIRKKSSAGIGSIFKISRSIQLLIWPLLSLLTKKFKTLKAARWTIWLEITTYQKVAFAASL
jgi:hypothetical protein